MTFDLAGALEQNEERLKPFMAGGSQPSTSPDSDALAFPDVMSGAAGDFAKVYGEALEPPKQFFFMAFLTCLGNILAGRATLNSELPVEPRLYTLILGESADDRKSTAISKTVDFFRETVTDFSVCYGIGSAEGLQNVLQKGPNALLVFDEFRSFVSKSRIDGSILLPCVTSLFEGNRFESYTKNHVLSIENAHLSLLAASTTDTYQQTWDNSFTAIGFTNRVFIVAGAGQRKNAFPSRIDFNDRQWLKRRLGEVLSHVGGGIELNITDDARSRYADWYMNLPQSVHAKRLDTYAMRFMSLFAVNDQKSIIDAETIHKVILLMDWQYRVRRLHDPIDADSAMAKVEERMRRVLETGGKSDRDFRRAVHANRIGLWVYQNALQNLQKANEIQWDKIGKRWILK